MSKKFEEMTKAELIKAATGYGIIDDIIGDTPEDKVKNDVYVSALNEYKDKQNATSGIVQAEEMEAAAPAFFKKKPTKAQVSEWRAEDLLIQVPVIVTCHDNSVEVQGDTNMRGIEVSWGNMHVGQTERVFLHGNRQYLTKGCIKTLKSRKMPQFETDEKTGLYQQVGVINKFSVVDVEGFTQEELDALKSKQNQIKLG